MVKAVLTGQYIAALIASLGSLVFGTAGGWTSPVLPQLKKPWRFGGFDIDDESESWVGGTMAIGALLGGPVAGLLMDRIGRKHTMMVTAFLFTMSYLVLVISPNILWVYVGRLSTGLSTGMASLVCPLYVAETASPQVRGFLGSWPQLMVTIGVLISYSLGAVVTWRWLSVCCILFSLVWMCLLQLVPDTPAYHICNGSEDQATASLAWLRGVGDKRDIAEELEEIKASVAMASSNKAGMTSILQRQNLIPLMISLLLMFTQQFSGISVVITYTDDIFADAGSSLNPATQTIVLGGVQVVATLIGAALMDKLGRRFLLMFSSIIMTLSLCGLGAFFFIKQNQDNAELANTLSTLPIVCLSTFMAAFSVGLGPIPWLMMSELFSPSTKGLASSIAVSLNWTFCFVTVKFFPGLKLLFGMAVTLWGLAATTMILTVIIFLVVPETKGKTLEEIQQLFKQD